MEYFTSQYISTHAKKIDFLKTLMNKELEDYANILKIYVDVDRSTFDSVFLEPLLSSFIDHFEREPQTEQIKKMRSLTFSRQYIVTKLKEEHTREILKSAKYEKHPDDSDDKEAQLSSVLFNYIRDNALDKYNFKLSTMRRIPNKKNDSINELSTEQCIVGTGISSNRNMNILLQILKEKKYPFINTHFEFTKKGVEKIIISESSFFNNLNNKVGNDLLCDKNTLFKDLELNLEELYPIMISIRGGFGCIIDYDEGKRFLEQMRKQNEEDFQLWN